MYKVIVVDIVRLISIIFDTVFYLSLCSLFLFLSSIFFSAFVLLIEHFIIGFSLSIILLLKFYFLKTFFSSCFRVWSIYIYN